MRIAPGDTKLFYTIWRPLLQCANAQQKIHPEMDAIADESLDPQKCMDIDDWIWDHPEMLDQFLQSQPSLSEDARAIVKSWKGRVRDTWIMERHLKSGTVFVGSEDNVYLVQGLVSSFEEMLWMYPLPIYVRATLLPFHDKIITDGLLSVLPVVIGPNIKQMAKETYLAAKKSGRICKSICFERL